MGPITNVWVVVWSFSFRVLLTFVLFFLAIAYQRNIRCTYVVDYSGGNYHQQISFCTQDMDSVPWVCCASGNVIFYSKNKFMRWCKMQMFILWNILGWLEGWGGETNRSFVCFTNHRILSHFALMEALPFQNGWIFGDPHCHFQQQKNILQILENLLTFKIIKFILNIKENLQ